MDWLMTGKGEDINTTQSIPALEAHIAEQDYLIETQKKVIRFYEKLEKSNQ